MSDSGDDNWFDKDIEEFKVPIKKKVSQKVTEQLQNINLEEVASSSRHPALPGNAFGPLDDYGGSYNIKLPTKVKKKSDENSTGKRIRGISTSGDVQKMSKKELLDILKMTPLDAFLEVMGNAQSFIETAFDDDKHQKTVIILIVILGNLHQVPLMHHLEYLMAQILKPKDVLLTDILNYVKYAVDLEERNIANLLPFADKVWSSLESFCSFGMRYNGKFNRWAFINYKICDILEGKTKESLVEKHSKFSTLVNDVMDNFFYQESIYGSLEDIMEIPKSRKSRIKKTMKMMRNEIYRDAKEYLTFQLTHLKNYFTFKLFEGITQLNKQEGDTKGKIVLENVFGTNIFPIVRIRKSFPQIMSFSDKYFVLDLAPNARVDQRLPENVREEVTRDDLILIAGSLLFLSTSPLFENLIVAEIPFLPEEIQREGFLVVDIVQMENIKECILNRNLILVTIPIMFEPIVQNLRALKKFSTATLPMKEYLVDCRTAAMLPDYENIEENDCSIEKIDLRSKGAKEEELRDLGMNERQFEAFQMALTRKLTLIQGPPGTGKTTVELNIIRRLLTNTSLRILVVSYRNLALDKLLARCSTFTDKIVRLGLQITNPEVLKFVVDRGKVNGRHYKVMKQNMARYSEAMEKFVDTMKGLEVGEQTSECTLEEDFETLRKATMIEIELTRIRMYYGCRDARIIGMTTSGAARYHELLQLLRPEVVIIEEAAEVPESHIITSLTEHTQQLILVGDHKQLTYSFDIDMGKSCTPKSLFERLNEYGVNNVPLNVQYRMHPDIADLLRNTIYDDFVDGENVKLYNPICGVAKNLFFVNHENLETLAQERYELLKKECPNVKGYSGKSKENFYEMIFTVGLANYLRQQGYQSHDIVILTLYSSQQLATASILVNFPLLKGVEVHTVDSFQGQECRIVILSLVRSNEKGAIGFLDSQHRLCVLLSRAQQGFYIVGNMKPLVAKSKAWEEIAVKLEAKNAIGPGLPLKCVKHKSKMTAIGMEDFLKFTRDGCPVAEKLPKKRRHRCLDNIMLK